MMWNNDSLKMQSNFLVENLTHSMLSNKRFKSLLVKWKRFKHKYLLFARNPKNLIHCSLQYKNIALTFIYIRFSKITSP